MAPFFKVLLNALRDCTLLPFQVTLLILLEGRPIAIQELQELQFVITSIMGTKL